MDNLRVSVIIPTHQRRQMLAEMLEALNEQSCDLSQVEVVVVMDGCTDDTPIMLREQRVHYQLTPVEQKQSGPAVARNHGARVARGDVLVFLDDDLVPTPDLLKEHLTIHAKDPRAVVLGRFLSPGRRYEAGRGGWNVWEARVLEKHYAAMKSGKRPPAGRRLYSGNVSLRRDLFLEAGGFDEQLQRGEDVELGFHLERLGFNFYFNPEASAVHRGYRSFESWRQSAYTYGRCDVRLATEKQHDVFAEVLGWYRRQPWLMRQFLTTVFSRPLLQRLAIASLKNVSGALTHLRFYDAAHYGYSAIYRIQFWQGVVDEVGGKELFLGALADQGRHVLAMAARGASSTPARKGMHD